jgi:hypothetical protein
MVGHRARKKPKQSWVTAFVAGALGLCAFSAQALKSDDNTLVEGAKLCTQYLPRHERQYGIPEHLLAAIASTESGRFHKALGLNLPWPWTINVEGAGYFFDTKEEAINAVRSFQARGIASIDVGCMQVNLMHHPSAFASLEEAFDPAYNVAYAAQFLKKNFTEENSWRKATADYHSHTPIYGEEYARLVYGAWERIINKVADARAGRPILNASASHTSHASYAHATPVHTYHSMHMHDISISSDTTREKGVVVIRPQHDSEAPVLQEARLDDNNDFVSHPGHPQSLSDALERSAIAPSGVIAPAAPAADSESHGAQIVKIRSDGTPASKGQFQPSSHITHISSAAPADTAPVTTTGAFGDSSSESAKSPFVFNN